MHVQVRAPIAIRRRLGISVLGLLSVAYAALIVNTELVIQRDRQQRHERLVMATAAAIEAQLPRRPGAPLPEAQLRAALNDFSATRVLVWLSRPGQPPLLPQTLSSAALRQPALLQAAGLNATGPQPPRAFRYGGDTYFTCSMPLAGGQGVLRFLEDVGVSPASRQDNLVVLFSLWLGLLLISGLILQLLLRQAIQPLARLEQALDQLSNAAGAEAAVPPLPPEQQPQELQGIVAATNRLTARLAHTWQQQQLLIHALSHELITPISLIGGHAARLQRHAVPLPAADQRLLQAIRDEARASERLVRDLLDLARCETGRLQLERQVFQVCDLLDQLVRDLRSLPWGERLEWQAAAPVWVCGDPQRFRQCVRNLLENAAKYAPADSPIRLIPALAAGRFLLAIADEGPGIPAAERERVFQPFTRLEQTAHQVPGAGIGLAVVRLLMQGMEGSVALVDGCTSGACVQLSLPVADPPEPA